MDGGCKKTTNRCSDELYEFTLESAYATSRRETFTAFLSWEMLSSSEEVRPTRIWSRSIIKQSIENNSGSVDVCGSNSWNAKISSSLAPYFSINKGDSCGHSSSFSDNSLQTATRSGIEPSL